MPTLASRNDTANSYTVRERGRPAKSNLPTKIGRIIEKIMTSPVFPKAPIKGYWKDMKEQELQEYFDTLEEKYSKIVNKPGGRLTLAQFENMVSDYLGINVKLKDKISKLKLIGTDARSQSASISEEVLFYLSLFSKHSFENLKKIADEDLQAVNLKKFGEEVKKPAKDEDDNFFGLKGKLGQLFADSIKPPEVLPTEESEEEKEKDNRENTENIQKIDETEPEKEYANQNKVQFSAPTWKTTTRIMPENSPLLRKVRETIRDKGLEAFLAVRITELEMVELLAGIEPRASVIGALAEALDVEVEEVLTMVMNNYRSSIAA